MDNRKRWANEVIESLKIQWDEGVVASEIAANLNLEFNLTLSKNAVISKVHIIGLTPRRKAYPRRNKSDPVKPKLRTPKKYVGNYNIKKSFVPHEIEPPVDQSKVFGIPEDRMGLVTILDLNSHVCRWPLGDPVEFYCGAATISDSVYCYRHFEISRHAR